MQRYALVIYTPRGPRVHSSYATVTYIDRIVRRLCLAALRLGMSYPAFTVVDTESAGEWHSQGLFPSIRWVRAKKMA